MKLRDFIVVGVILELFLGVFLVGLLGGFAGGVLLPENSKSKILETCGRFSLTATAPATSFLVKEDGNEDCDASFLERSVPRNTDFFQELRLVLENVKIIVEDVLAEHGDEFEGEAEESQLVVIGQNSVSPAQNDR